MNSVASGFCTDVKHRITDAGGFAEEDLIVSHETECKRIYERVQRISIVKRDFTADSRNTKRVTVVRDTCNDTGQQRSITTTVLRVIERSEAQAIHRRNRTRAHREDVAQDAADTSRRALKRLDERRMIVRLDLERRAPPIAEIHDAGILARRNDHAWSSGGQTFEMNARRFVGTVFRPHDRENPELGKTRFTAQQFFYSLKFLWCEVVGGDNFRSNHQSVKDPWNLWLSFTVNHFS